MESEYIEIATPNANLLISEIVEFCKEIKIRHDFQYTIHHRGEYQGLKIEMAFYHNLKYLGFDGFNNIFII